MIHFDCTCGNALFFENNICLQCGSTVGYDPVANTIGPVAKGFVRCRNDREYGVCNWVVPATGPEYCVACRLNRTVPDLSVPANLDGWHKMEAAKRRAIYTLLRLGITPAGVVFDFLTPTPQLRVTTGHENGVITLNTLEADDLYRERERHMLGEPYRTLVGHFRHELGHYYWGRFFLPPEAAPLLTEYRALFGDERADYAAALARHYANGPVATWPTTHITGYAASHPWEDWAETWAQYLHIVDGAETAIAFGWASASVPLPFTPFVRQEVLADAPAADSSFLDTLNGWAKLSPALNELAASLGHPTLNPFVFSSSSVRKILFVHKMAGIAAEKGTKQPAPKPLKTPSATAAAA
jgi:hypothetical protein